MQASSPIQRIVLAGFMGSGKTTVGCLLAERLGWQFSDLDREVERHAGKSVPSIFAEQGESRFRELEATVLATLLPRERLVLALGGGAPEFRSTNQLLQAAPSTLIVYLSAPFTTLARRCRTESARPGAVHRPLSEDELAAQIRFTRREPLYESLAHLTISTDGLLPDGVAQAVLAASHLDVPPAM